MSYEINSKPQKIVIRTCNRKIYLWFEDYGDFKPSIRVKTSPSKNPLLEASLLAAGANNEVGLSYGQFFELIKYVFENENVFENDPRLIFLDRIKKTKIIKGHQGLGKRLDF